MEHIGIERFPERAAVRVSPTFLRLLKERARERFGSFARFAKQMDSDSLAGTTIYSALKCNDQRHFFPLSVLFRCCENCGISAEELQHNIIAYGLQGSTLHVRPPILPIQITPVFDMLYAHHIADGFVDNPGRNRLPYFGYRQFDTLYRLLYWEKIQSVFGEINFDYDRALETTCIYCPPSVSQFFFQVYNVGTKDFLSEKAMLPAGILEKNNDHLLAVLIAFLIDEGHIDGSCALVSLKNPPLVHQLHGICQKLGYSSVVRVRPSMEGYAILYIRSDGLCRFWRDYCEIIKRYPVMDLGWKGNAIQQYLETKLRPISRTPGNKDVIVSLLRAEALTINDIAARIRMTRQGVRYLVNDLINKHKVIRIGRAKWDAVLYVAIT